MGRITWTDILTGHWLISYTEADDADAMVTGRATLVGSTLTLHFSGLGYDGALKDFRDKVDCHYAHVTAR